MASTLRFCGKFLPCLLHTYLFREMMLPLQAGGLHTASNTRERARGYVRDEISFLFLFLFESWIIVWFLTEILFDSVASSMFHALALPLAFRYTRHYNAPAYFSIALSLFALCGAFCFLLTPLQHGMVWQGTAQHLQDLFFFAPPFLAGVRFLTYTSIIQYLQGFPIILLRAGRCMITAYIWFLKNTLSCFSFRQSHCNSPNSVPLWLTHPPHFLPCGFDVPRAKT